LKKVLDTNSEIGQTCVKLSDSSREGAVRFSVSWSCITSLLVCFAVVKSTDIRLSVTFFGHLQFCNIVFTGNLIAEREGEIFMKNVTSRRDVVRSASILFALPLTEALMPTRATAETALPGGSQIPKIKFTTNAATAFSMDMLNYVKDHAARAVAAAYQGGPRDYIALGDQFHMLGKHLSSAGADKAVKAHCKKLLKTGAVPTLDPQAIAHAVSCVRVYAPSFTSKTLLSSVALPATPQEWSMHMKKLKKNGVVKYCHRAARQLNAMGQVAHNQQAGLSAAGTSGSFQSSAYDPTDPAQAAHLVDICSLSQKLKFFACLGATVVAGLLILAGLVALCGATALAACLGGSVFAGAFFAGFGLLTSAALALCTLYLSSYHEHGKHPAALTAI
jgi:hypothetical protein